MLSVPPSVQYSTVVTTKEASDENRRKATEARLGGIEGALGSTAAVERPDPRAPLGQAGLCPGRRALGAVMLERGRLVTGSVMRIERAEIAGPDYDPSGLMLQKRAHEEGSIFIGGQKGRVPHPRLRHVVQGGASKPSYVVLYSPGQFFEELLKKSLRGVSPAETYRARHRFDADMAQVLAPIEAEYAEPQSAPTKKAVRDNHGSRSEHFNERIDNLSRIAGQR